MRVAILASALLLPATAASADPIELYLGAGGGINVAGTLRPVQSNTTAGTSAGPLGLAALGVKLGNGFRAEIEGSYRANRVSGIATRRDNDNLLPLSNVEGHAAIAAVMSNMAYDMPYHPFGLPVQPYIGAGIGYARFDFDGAHGNGLGRFLLPQNNVYVGPDMVTFGGGDAFAYQAFVGSSLPVTAFPRFEVTLEYRFFGTTNAAVPVSRVAMGGNAVNGVIPANVARNDFAQHDSAVLIGLRYGFGAATP